MAEGGLSTSSGRQRRALLGDDDANMVFETSKEVSVVATFDQMNLREDLLRGIYAYGKSYFAVVYEGLCGTYMYLKDSRSHLQFSRERLSQL